MRQSADNLAHQIGQYLLGDSPRLYPMVGLPLRLPDHFGHEVTFVYALVLAQLAEYQPDLRSGLAEFSILSTRTTAAIITATYSAAELAANSFSIMPGIPGCMKRNHLGICSCDVLHQNITTGPRRQPGNRPADRSEIGLIRALVG
jgi:hypothetical protein